MSGILTRPLQRGQCGAASQQLRSTPSRSLFRPVAALGARSAPGAPQRRGPAPPPRRGASAAVRYRNGDKDAIDAIEKEADAVAEDMLIRETGKGAGRRHSLGPCRRCPCQAAHWCRGPLVTPIDRVRCSGTICRTLMPARGPCNAPRARPCLVPAPAPSHTPFSSGAPTPPNQLPPNPRTAVPRSRAC
jgi:hypothetical protein